MPDPALLETRLQQIAQTLQSSGGLGLLALGSVGVERARLDRWSDLDFFLIVPPGTKDAFRNDTHWFSRVAPVEWIFRNTGDGYKLLFADGVFGEMAWFEPAELASIPYAPGRWVWRSPELDEAWAVSQNPGRPASLPDSSAWALGELLSCLYVGLCRWNRGEKLSAWRFIQTYCLDRFLELVELTQPSAPFGDYYSWDRRWEARHPGLGPLLARFLKGYEDTPSSSLAFLDWCELHFEVNPGLAREIRTLARCEKDPATTSW